MVWQNLLVYFSTFTAGNGVFLLKTALLMAPALTFHL
jgi:hypothetical protein